MMPRLPECKSDEQERLNLSPEERGLERGGASPYGKERTGEVAKKIEWQNILYPIRHFLKRKHSVFSHYKCLYSMRSDCKSARTAPSYVAHRSMGYPQAPVPSYYLGE